MKLDLQNPLDLQKFKTYANKLVNEKAKVELKKVSVKRSISLNSYLHVVITLFAIEYGYTLEEAKTLMQ